MTNELIDLYRQAQPAIRAKYGEWVEHDSFIDSTDDDPEYLFMDYDKMEYENEYRRLYSGLLMTPPPVGNNGRDLWSMVDWRGLRAISTNDGLLNIYSTVNGIIEKMLFHGTPAECLLRAILIPWEGNAEPIDTEPSSHRRCPGDHYGHPTDDQMEYFKRGGR